MKYTLLELTQNVLSSMDSDEINSISDTVESLQVVKIIKNVYDDILSRSDMTVNQQLFNLTASGTVTYPVIMYKPDAIERIFWIKYNTEQDGDTDPVWTEISYLSQPDFLAYTQELHASEDYVDTMTYVTPDNSSFVLNYFNDRAPHYYTTFDDNTIIFDAYDSEVDATLQSSKTTCYGNRRTSFQEVDGFIPDLQPAQFNLLLNEAKALAWAELKQMPHVKAESMARKNWVHVGRTRQNIPSGSFGSGAHPFDKLPNFGRK